MTDNEQQTKREQVIADLATMGQQMFSPTLPTREQIAEAIYHGLADRGFDFKDDDTVYLTDAILALIQNGAER